MFYILLSKIRDQITPSITKTHLDFILGFFSGYITDKPTISSRQANREDIFGYYGFYVHRTCVYEFYVLILEKSHLQKHKHHSTFGLFIHSPIHTNENINVRINKNKIFLCA